MYEIIDQCEILYTFFLENLSDGCNYQRMITTLNLLNILLENTLPRLTEIQKKKRMPTIEYLASISKWHFRSSACRESLFNCLKDDNTDILMCTKHILQTYFAYPADEFSIFETNFKFSLKMSRSNVFYVAESGAYAVSLLVHLFYKSNFNNRSYRNSLMEVLNLDSTVVSIADLSISDQDCRQNFFSAYFLNLCIEQANLLQKDIFLAVKNKNCLHGSLTTLMLILTETSSPEFCSLDEQQVQRLLQLLNDICLFLLDALCMKSKSTSFAPSFGEMGEAMKSLITEDDEDDQLNLSPAHQTLFNCIWMNLKICCTFASELAAAYNSKLSKEQILFACKVITHVLHKCRHKGAIQNAGLALSTIVSKCLFNDVYPLELLVSTLNSVLDFNNTGGTVSRKSAGVAILVHKLVASNHKLKDKLFTIAMDKILEVANSPVLISLETLKVDLPQAVAFHMLQFLVADSGLRVSMFPYLEQITLLCFDKMNSHEWTIRNAALQVFGVLLPKLVGTKKQDNENQSSNVAIEEFFYQLPRIRNCLEAVLTSQDEGNTSALVSALSLLSRLETTGTLFQSSQVSFKSLFSRFLSNNNDTIRFLTAHCYVNHLFVSNPCEQFSEILVSCLKYIFGNQVKFEKFDTNQSLRSVPKIKNENDLHGYLLTLQYWKEKLAVERIQLETSLLQELLRLLSDFSAQTRCVQLNMFALLLNIFRYEAEKYELAVDEKKFLNTICEVINNPGIKRRIGWKRYVNELIKFNLQSLMWTGEQEMNFELIISLVKILHKQSDILRETLEHLSSFLLHYNKTYANLCHGQPDCDKFIVDQSDHAQVFIGNYLSMISKLDLNKTSFHYVVQIPIQVYNIFVLDSKIKSQPELINVGNILFEKYYLNKSIVHVTPRVLPIAALCAVLSGDYTDNLSPFLDNILKCMDIFIDGDDSSEEMRYHAALAMSILYGRASIMLRPHINRLIFTHILNLLQDEVCEVRKEVTYCSRIILYKSDSITPTQNPYVCWDCLFCNPEHLSLEDQLNLCKDYLLFTEEDYDRPELDDVFINPFDHNVRNFYCESIIPFRKAIGILKRISSTNSTQFGHTNIVDYLSKIINKNLNQSNLKQQGVTKLNLLTQARDSLMQIEKSRNVS